jgi:transposase
MVSVGIDVSKGKSTVCILKPYGEVILSPYEINHIEAEMTDLILRLRLIESEVKIVMEATGAYHFPVLQCLKEAGFFVSVINPLVMKKYASTALRKAKTDKIDSIRVANYELDNWFRLVNYQAPEEVYEELRQLGRHYSHYVKIRIQCKLNLDNLLQRTMPGIKTLLQGKRSDEATKDKLSDFAEEYWHYDNIKKKSESQFVTSYAKWAKKKGYHQSEAKAKKIYAMALGGIPTLSSNCPSTKMLMLEAVKVLREVNRTLETILSQMQMLAKSLPEYNVVRSMNGVGDVLAPRLIAEIGDVRRFRNGSSLIAYAGIDSPPYESGSFVGTKRNITKRGSSLLRKTGYEVMKCVKSIKPKNDNAVYLFMLKKEAEGKPKNVAKIAALNKFLRIYYARVKEAYQPEHHELYEHNICVQAS